MIALAPDIGTVMSYAVVLLAVLTGTAGILHACAAYERAHGHSQTSAKIEIYEHALEALVSAGRKHEQGESFFEIAVDEARSPQGAALVKALLDRVAASPGAGATPPDPAPPERSS